MTQTSPEVLPAPQVERKLWHAYRTHNAAVALCGYRSTGKSITNGTKVPEKDRCEKCYTLTLLRALGIDA